MFACGIIHKQNLKDTKMLIPKQKNRIKKEMKPIAFRISTDVVKEFKELCREVGITQSSIMENAMRMAIKEMRELKRNDND